MSDQVYIYRFKRVGTWLHACRERLFGRRCRVLARGKFNSALIQFIDTGERCVVSRNALRKVKP